MTPLDKAQELQKTIDALSQYVQHLAGCEEHMTEFCTCGMREAKQAFNAALKAFARSVDNG